jgi:Ca-activated chloride channel homolog
MKSSILFFVFLILVSYVNTVSALENASVLLHGEKTDVVLGEDIILKLSAVNIITNPVMAVQVILIPPSGMSVTSSEFVTSGAGQFTSTFNLNPGDGKDIEVRIRTNQAGDFNVIGRVIYYFGNDKSTKEDYSVDLPITVRGTPVSTQTPPIETMPKFGTNTLIIFGIIIMVLIFAAIYILGSGRINYKKTFSIIILIMGIILLAIILINSLPSGPSKSSKSIDSSDKNVSIEKATETMNSLYNEITVNQITAKKGHVDLNPPNIKESLPDISKYPAQVENPTVSYIEIFSSTEKAGEGKDGWLVDTAKAFNRANIQVNGKTVSVRIRGIASGMGMDYIASRGYIPDVFTPSNELWGEMLKSKGIKITLIEKRLAGNVAGVVISKKKHDELIKKYGSINLKTITEAVANNEIEMGYTNPFASSTGLNFLIYTLSSFDNKNPLSEKAVKGFEKFQTNIPFVAYTTLQMRDSAQSGVLDGFILEYQTYINTDLKFDYIFIPFGVRHDSPMYQIGDLSSEKKEILKKFIEFSKSDKYQELATSYGFNNYNDYKPEIGDLDGSNVLNGDVISQAQKLYKEKKDVNNEIVAVFVADISGSMQGAPLNKLKTSLLSGSKYISKDNSIGLVTFSTDVNINLPIGKFDINQRSLFTGSVENMQAGGSTAMFDGIIVGTKMLMEEKAKNPKAKLLLFVLTDGETNSGHSLNDVEGILKALKIPIYTIGYNANIKTLQTVSSINEAASINADTDDVVYKLGSLFNAVI